MGLEERRQEKEIDGTLYEVTPLPFGIGQKALVRAIHVLSPLFGAALKDGGEGTAKYAAIFDVLPRCLTEDDVSYFSKVFGGQSKYQDGERWVPLIAQNQELHFAAKYPTFFKWLFFNFEVNFAGFIDGTMSEASVSDVLQGMIKKAS